MVHDPLRLDPTPWELLALPADLFETIRERLASEPGAGSDLTGLIDREFRKALDRAFTQALRSRVPPQKAKAARDTLLRPTGRARIALLSFPDADFARLAGELGPAALEPRVRAETARAWEERFATALDDLPAAHCLLALWWSWAHHEELRIRDKAMPAAPPGTPDRFTMWSAVIGYVGLMAAERAFVAERFELAPEAATTLLDELVEELKADLLDRAQWLGNSVEGKRYRLLERFLAQEVHTARVLGAARVAFGGVERALGPRLLARLGLTQAADAARREAALKVSVNPYAALETLAREGKPDLALDAIEVLPPAERATQEAERARAVVISVQAFRQVKAGKLEQALVIWARTTPGSLSAETEAEIVRLVRERVEELTKSRNDRAALDLLLLAVKVLPGSEALRGLATSERYNKALRTLERIRERVARGRIGLTDMRTLSEAIDELESAVALGIEGVAAQVDWARAAVETHSIGGQSNRQARAKLDVALGWWRDGSRKPKLLSTLRELVSEFRTAARLGSRLARANADLVERLLERVSVRPGERPALVRAELVRLDELRGAAGPGIEDLSTLEDLLFDLEPAAVGSPEAAALATQLKGMIAGLCAARGVAVLQGLAEPLRGPGGVRLVTATSELKALLAAREDLKRALALDPRQGVLRGPLADVTEALERAGATKPAGTPEPAGLGQLLLRAPLAVVLIVVALVILLIWLLKSVGKGLRSVHR